MKGRVWLIVNNSKARPDQYDNDKKSLSLVEFATEYNACCDE